MGKLYYTDPLQAAYMAKEFGVDFVIKWWGEEIIAKHSDAIKQPKQFVANMIMKHKTGKFCIHPDSYHIFDPQVGDLVVKAGNIRLLDKIGTIGHITKDKQVYLEADYHDDGGAHEGSLVHITASSKVKIIQRNNKPFFWPMEDKSNETN